MNHEEPHETYYLTTENIKEIEMGGFVELLTVDCRKITIGKCQCDECQGED